MVHFVSEVTLSTVYDSTLLFFLLHLGETLLLVNNLVFHLVFGLDLELVVADLLLILCALDLGLLGLLCLGEIDRFLHFALLFSSLLLNHVVLVRVVALHL